MANLYQIINLLADQYDIPMDAIDIIWKHIFRNNIKRCTNEFINPRMENTIKRLVKSITSDPFQRRLYLENKVNYGRIMLRVIYPKCLYGGHIRQIDNYRSQEISVNGLMYKSDTNYSRGGNIKAIVSCVDEKYYNELPLCSHLSQFSRGDLIRLIDYHNLSLKNQGLIDKIPKYPKNKKTEYYIYYLIPKVSNYKK